MKAYLKVKIKSLAAEAKIIRHEEGKVKTTRAFRREVKRLLRLGVQTRPLPVDPVTGHEVMDKSLFLTLSNSERDLHMKRAEPPSPKQLDVFFGLQFHRKNEVRQEARSAQLAYAYIRGVPYRKVEPTDKLRNDGRLANKPDYPRIQQIVNKYGQRKAGDHVTSAAIEAWCATSATATAEAA